MINIDWGTRIIHIPQAFLTPMGSASFTLDTNEFRLALRDLEDNVEGIPFLPTHNHNTKVPLGGIEYARVIAIINGYTITFEDVGTPYRVFLSGSNNNILDVTNLNNVSVAPNNSAGLVQMAEIQQGVFNGGITIDVLNGSAGTLYPTGTPLRPVNNIADANTIADSRGFTIFFIRGDIVLDTGDDVSGRMLIGDNAMRTLIILNPGSETTNVEIQNAAVTGTMDGSTILRQCYVFDLEYVAGFIFESQIAGDILLGGVMPANFLSCFSDSVMPHINMGGTGHDLNISDWFGDMRIRNKTGPNACFIHSSAASVYLDATITDGIGIHIGGTGRVINESSIIPQTVYMISPETVGEAVIAAAQVTPIHGDVRKINDAVVIGDGTPDNLWRGDV